MAKKDTYKNDHTLCTTLSTWLLRRRASSESEKVVPPVLTKEDASVMLLDTLLAICC